VPYRVQLIDKAFDISRKNLNLRLNRLKPKQMKKLYSYLLAGLAVLMVSGLSAQVTGITVTNTAPCPGETVTVSWNAGSDGGTPFEVTVSTVAYGGVDVFGPSLFFANTVDFPVASGETYYVTVRGNGAGAATNVPMIVTSVQPTMPTGFTLNTVAATKVCATTPFTMEATGQILGDFGTVEWYDNDEVTNNVSGVQYNNAGIAVLTTYKVRIEDATCNYETPFLTVPVDVFTAVTGGATGVDFNGGASPVCPGVVTFSQTGAALGDNPGTTVRYYSDAGFTTEYVGASTTLASAANADVYVRVTDACGGATYDAGPFNVIAKTASTAPVSVTTSVGGPVCSGDPVTYTANGATEGTGFTYEYQVNGAGAWIVDADGVVLLNITEATSVAFRLKDDCNTVGTASMASPSVAVFTASTDVTAVTHTAGADNEICAGSAVTFTANGALGTSGGTQFEVQITENGAVTAWAPTANPMVASHTMNITALGTGTVVEFRVNDGCTGLGAEVASATVNVAADNVAPTTLTADIPVTCGDQTVTFTSDGTLGGNGAVFQFSTDLAFGTILQSGTSNTYSTLVSADIPNMYVRILGGCNDVSGITPSASVDHVLANVAPTSLLADVNNVCPGSTVTFTANGTLGLGASYEFDTDVAFGSIDETNITGTYATVISANTTMYARISGGCNDVSVTVVDSNIVTKEVTSAISDILLDGVSATALTTCGDSVVTIDAVSYGASELPTNNVNTWGRYQVNTSIVAPPATMPGDAYEVDVWAGSGAENIFSTLSNPIVGIAHVSFWIRTTHAPAIGSSLAFAVNNQGGVARQQVVVDGTWTFVTADLADINGNDVTYFHFYPGMGANGSTSNWNGATFEVYDVKVQPVGQLSAGSTLEYSDDGFGTFTSSTSLSFDVNVTADVTYDMRINDACNPALLADVKTVTFDHNVDATDDVTIESSEDFDFCIANAPTAKTFTAKIGTIGTGGQLQYSTDNATWFNTDDATNSSSFTIADITSVSNIYVQLVGSCNAGSIASVDSSVTVSVQADGTVDVASDLATANVACGLTTVEFDFDNNNDVILNDGMYVYAFTSFGGAADWSNSDTVTSNLLSGIVIDRDTTLHVQLIDCSGNVNTDSYDVDYVEPTDVSAIIVKSEYGEIGSLAPVTVTPICIGDDVYVSVSNYTMGDGATMQYSIDAGGTWANVVDDTVKVLDIQLTTTVDFQVIGSCNVPAAIPSSTINVYDAIPEVTSLTIDKDNLCANDGEVVRLTAFTTVPVATPYVYEWSKYKASNNTYTVIAGAPDAAIYDVTPDTVTAYSVRIIGCNDTSAYVTRLVTIKDTSSVAGAMIVTNAGMDDKVCAGSLVTYNLSGGKKGYDAQLFWYNDNDVLVGQGNPFIMTVTQDTTLYAKYIGECNTTVNSVSKTIEVYEQSDVDMEITIAGDTAQCVGSMADLVALTTTTPVGGNFSGANVAGNVLDVQLGMNVFTYTFDFGGCDFSVNDTIYGIAAPIAAVLADSTLSNTCAGAVNVGAFQVDDVNNEGLTFTVPTVGSYLTNAADTVAEFTGLAAGNYTINVTNSIGCITNLAVEIISEGGLSAKIDTANSSFIVCNGASTGMLTVVADSGVAPYEYSFVDNVPTFSSKNDTTGLDGSEVFDIIVKDASGCEFTVASNVSIISNANNASLTLKNIVEPTCYDALDGRFDAVATGGFGPYMYSLDGVNFQSESRFDNLSVDVYTVTVRNTLMFAGQNVPGCEQNFISPLLGPDSLSVVQSIVSGDPINGYEVLFTIAGGNGGYEISINGGDFGTTFQLSQSSGAYNYVVRDVNGCTKSGSYVLDGVDAVNDINDVVSSVYPNPFTNTLTLVGADMVNAEVVFTDINGKVLAVEMEASNDKVVISTSDVASGIYLVRVVTNNGSTVKRVIKN
jgi:hypothetical protein